jgi:predicted phage terminase large subunit-like protein
VPAEGIERDIDKVRRVNAILPFQESGLVHIPNEKRDDAPEWVNKFLNECGEFKPDGTHLHDDMVDAMCDGVQLTLGRSLSILDVLGGKAQ